MQRSITSRSHLIVVRSALAIAVLGGGAIGKTPPCAAAPSDHRPRIALVGLHGGIFETLEQCASAHEFELIYWSDRAISQEAIDPRGYDMVLVQHVQASWRKQFAGLIRRAAEQGTRHIISISGLAEKHVPGLVRDKLITRDENLSRYYGSSAENLDRMLKYLAVTYFDKPGPVLPPEPADLQGKLFHPDREGLFPDAESFLAWAAEGAGERAKRPLAVIAVHQTHLIFQQPRVVEALIRALEKEGVTGVAVVDLSPAYEATLRRLRPAVVIHTCHSRESVPFRKSLGAPHLHSIFLRSPPIAQWRTNLDGLSAHDLAFQVTSQELLGAIEPLVGAGRENDDMTSAYEPIDDRIARIARRAAGWCRLATVANDRKRVAVVYYDREAGKAELMRGSATGMFLNAPRSVLRLLKELDATGYRIDNLPLTESSLLERVQAHGRLIGPWNADLLEPLARSGKAGLVPVERYRKWFEQHVPPNARQQVIDSWGPPPGRFMVWNDGQTTYLVVPHVRLGNVVLMPQPLRGEAFDVSKLHDRRVPPPHHYLAAYFWLQESFRADAVIHFGTHGSEFLLPGKPTGLRRSDWPDIVLGSMPNIQPWVINNLGESSPVRRRAAAVLIDHLVPPSVAAELSDELAAIHADIDKWWTLEDGALKEAFRRSITDQFHQANLARDVGWEPLGPDKLLTDQQIRQLLTYLHDLHNETIPTSLHVLGMPPPLEQQVPWIVTCLGESFLEALSDSIVVPEEESLTAGDRTKYLRRQAEALVEQVLRNGLRPEEALAVVSDSNVSDLEMAPRLDRMLQQIERLHTGFDSAGREIDAILEALDGRYVAPGPGNSPDRNPAVVPTGRNMYVMNPEEVPSRPSWRIGVQLAETMLEQHRKRHGHWPRRVAFALNSFATFQDYGVMESQILYLLGVRPVWDANQRVQELELIPRAELGRPRIDVFISVLGYYRDMLPTRMRLLDEAVRLAATGDEADNSVRDNTRRIAGVLAEQGMDSERAAVLARARIFGAPLGQFGSAGYYYLVERSGEWDSREQLVEAYLGFARHAYTESMWGTPAPETYDLQIQGCDILLRSWSDRTRSPLSNKYMWYKGGSLSAAIRHLTGREPEWFLSDVRDPQAAKLVDAESALRKDFRVRLFNRKWIEGMKRQGYAGADQIAVHVSNTYGWKIMRPASVDDDMWNEIVDTYVRDSRRLDLRTWFESTNPFAFQELTEILLEAARKGFWSPDQETLREVVQAYAESVIEHGEGGGLRGGGNEKLRAFVVSSLRRSPSEGSEELIDRFVAAGERPADRRDDRAPDRSAESASGRAVDSSAAAPAASESPVRSPSVTKNVHGQRLEPKEPDRPELRSLLPLAVWIGIGLAAGLVVTGFQRGRRHR